MYILLSESSMGTTHGAFLLPQAANLQQRCKTQSNSSLLPGSIAGRGTAG